LCQQTKSESKVRTIQFNTLDGYLLAAGHESGQVKILDTRKLDVVMESKHAHHNSCTVEWSPGYRHMLASGSFFN
jgi:hypothetical protein